MDNYFNSEKMKNKRRFKLKKFFSKAIMIYILIRIFTRFPLMINRLVREIEISNNVIFISGISFILLLGILYKLYPDDKNKWLIAGFIILSIYSFIYYGRWNNGMSFKINIISIYYLIFQDMIWNFKNKENQVL